MIDQQNLTIHNELYSWAQTLGIYQDDTKSFSPLIFSEIKTLGRNQSFGELALQRYNQSERRASRVVCTEGSIFFTVSKFDYRRAIDTNVRKEMQEKVYFLK